MKAHTYNAPTVTAGTIARTACLLLALANQMLSALGKPVLVPRTETERPEAVTAGTVKIAGVDTDTIVDMANTLIRDKAAYSRQAGAVNPYGDGHASARICDAVLYYFGLGDKPKDFGE